MGKSSNNLLEVGRSYSFNIYPNQIIEDNFHNVVCIGLFGYSVATALSSEELLPLHAQVYPYLPPGIEDDATIYTYAQFEFSTGEKKILALPWINIDTLVDGSSAKDVVIAEIRGITPQQITLVRDVLVHNGFNNVRVYTRSNIDREEPVVPGEFARP